MGNPAAAAAKINEIHIKKYLTDENYKANLNNNTKLKIDNGTALYEGIRLSQIADFEKKTIYFFIDDRIKGFAKQMQNIIKREAVALGYTEENN